MKKKKPNPRKIPRIQADVEHAADEARKRAVTDALAIFLTVLLDKENADEEILCRVWREIMDLSGSIAEGYVSIADLKHVLKTEYNIFIDD